jgi:hypothetical protein
MSNAIDDYLVRPNLEDCAMCGFAAKPIMNLAKLKVDRAALSGDNTSFWMLGQRRKQSLETFQPAKSLLRRPMLRPPKRLLK